MRPRKGIKSKTDDYNNRTYLQYYNRLKELAISAFDWKNLPDTVDERFLELALFNDGMAMAFNVIPKSDTYVLSICACCHDSH